MWDLMQVPFQEDLKTFDRMLFRFYYKVMHKRMEISTHFSVHELYIVEKCSGTTLKVPS